MLSLPGQVRIFLCLRPTDMRRSFDGLAAMVRQVLLADPLSKHLFVFISRRADRLKIFYWDRDGLALWAKRLERSTFRPPAAEGEAAALSAAELALLLEGLEPAGVTRRARDCPAIANDK